MSFCGISITLSLVFGFLLLALAAQLYYFLCWRKKIRAATTTTTHSLDIENNMGLGLGQGNHHHHHPKGLFHWGCWKILPRTVHADADTSGNVAKDPAAEQQHEQEEMDFVVMSSCEEGVEAELMRLHNLAGPPRFLFTIKEETKEDLESEDGKSVRSRKGSRTRSLSDLMMAIETPFGSPSPLRCPLENLESFKHQGFNPLFESSEVVFRSSSPPPKFKFMRDAEEKLCRRLIEEARRKALIGVKDSSFAKIETEHKTEFQQYLNQFPSGSSQVLPLASSPTSTTFIPVEKASSMVH